MPVIAKQQISLYLTKLRNFNNYATGNYFLSINIFALNPNKKLNQMRYCVPINTLESQEDRISGQINDWAFCTKDFRLKQEKSVNLNIGCIFKNDINIYEYEDYETQLQLLLKCELQRVEHKNQSEVISTCNCRLIGSKIKEYIELDFFGNVSCQVAGILHSIIYRYELTDQKLSAVPLNIFKSQQAKGAQMVQYLLEAQAQQLKSLKRLCKTYGEKLKKTKPKKLKTFQLLPKQSPLKKKLKQPKGQTTQFPQLPQEASQKIGKELRTSKKLKGKLTDNHEKLNKTPKKTKSSLEKGQKALSTSAGDRKKSVTAEGQEQQDNQNITNIRNELKGLKGVQLTQSIHQRVEYTAQVKEKQQNGKRKKKIFNLYQTNEQQQLQLQTQDIYETWRELHKILLSQKLDSLLEVLEDKYNKQIEKKMGESIIKYKGEWSVDSFAHQHNERAKMVSHLRKTDFNDAYYENQFKVQNLAYFTKERPIYFQETAIPFGFQQAFENRIFVVLVHGLGACRLDMEKLKVELKRHFHSRIKVYVSSANQGRTQQDITLMGGRLASEIQHEIMKFNSLPKICLIGHSMGGIIIRCALPQLQKYKDCFHSLITFSAPHIGYSYSTSRLIDTGLWLINTWKKCNSILQLTMLDQDTPKQCLLYKLSRQIGLEWFNKVTFLSSHQDQYVPFYSARIQKFEEAILDQRNNIEKGVIYCSMVDNLLSQIKGKITRLNVDFYLPEQTIDNLIGRAAHICFINNYEMLRTFCINGKQLIY